MITRVFFVALPLFLIAVTAPAEKEETRLHFTEKDLPAEEKDPDNPSEIDEFARGRNFNYAKDTRRAVHGDARALKKFFEIAQDADGAAAESIWGVPTVVIHVLGDKKFAKFLAAQPLSFRMMVRNRILGDRLPSPASVYLDRYFPLTTKLLLRREIDDWISPDGAYGICKVFSAALDLPGSKVERAELIDKKSGRVLCDLTEDDIGTGAQREGEALWAPDSKRVACLSSDLSEQQGNLFSTPRPAPLRKQTAVYQLSGDRFTRVDLSLDQVPGREQDAELKGAILGHEYTEPVRWEKPNVLVLTRHEYFQKLMPTTVDNLTFDSIHDLSRLYQITVTFDPEGRATAVWESRDQ